MTRLPDHLEEASAGARALVLRIPDMPQDRPDLIEFGAHLLGLGRSAQTVRTYVFSILRIERAIDKQVRDLVAVDVVLFRSLGLSPATTQVTISLA
jgi:hypothetical protein